LFRSHLRIVRPWGEIPPATAASIARWQMQAGVWLFTVWIVGTAVAVGLFAWQLVQSHRFVNSCEDISLHSLVGEEIAAELLQMASFRLRTAAASPSPFCWQFHTPCIVLPKSILSLAPNELRLILKHEVEHLRTGHPLELFIQRLTEAIFWFHPMVWWASHQAALAREFVCDDAAVNSKKEIADYLRTLLKVVEIGAAESETDAGKLAFGRGLGSIASRARRLVVKANGDQDSPPHNSSRLGQGLYFVMASLVIALVWLPVDALASPRSIISPWPKWSAVALHDWGITARDYEVFDSRSQLYELDSETH
ncbi:MAG: M56 family metallopeptidase, partial [Candidatus Korobacteraceae bacterium]